MTTLTPTTRDSLKKVELSDACFADIAARAYNDFGLHLHDGKRDLVHARLIRRLRALQIPDFSDYIALLDRPEGQEERLHMLSALTTNVTHFFREEHHFDLIANVIAANAIPRLREGGRLRIWSAGCSAGQEPYSIAARLLSSFPEIMNYDALVLATDVDPKILKQARRGSYREDEIASLSHEQREMLFDSEERDEEFNVKAEVRSIVRFGELNLIGDWPMNGPFDAILCRNVAIYFDKSTQARLWQRFLDLLRDDGHLLIGHSERLSGAASTRFKSVGTTAFRKVPAVSGTITTSTDEAN